MTMLMKIFSCKLIFNCKIRTTLIQMKTLMISTMAKYKKTSKYKNYLKLFAIYTDMNNREIRDVLWKNVNLLNLPLIHMIKSLKICQESNIHWHDSYHNVGFLYLNEDELQSRILILKETGAQYITAAMIQRTPKNTPIILFKSFTNIPEDVNISKNLYSYLHKPPKTIPPLENLNEYMVIYKYRKKCLKHYLQWRLQYSQNDTDLFDLSKSLMYKPFSHIKRTFDILHYNGKMPIETIRKHKCLQHSSWNDLRKIFDEIPSICNVSISNLLEISPRLCKMTYENVLTIKQCLENYNINSEQLQNYPDILLLSSTRFKNEWATLMANEKLKILMKHPLFLQMFTLSDSLSIRLKYLDYLNVPYTNADILIKRRRNFEKSLTRGRFKNRARDIIYLLNRELNLDPSIAKEIISKHPCWHYIDLYNASDTLEYLKKTFDIQDIINNVHILLYPKEKVERILTKIIHNNKVMDESYRYTPSQSLALCIYEIEKKFHFTGDGVWEKNCQEKLQSMDKKYAQEIEKLQSPLQFSPSIVNLPLPIANTNIS